MTRLQEAAAALEHMSERSRFDQTYYFRVLCGFVHYYLRDYGSAIAELRAVGPGDPLVWCILGQAYEHLGDEHSALAYYRDAALGSQHDAATAYARPIARKKLGM